MGPTDLVKITFDSVLSNIVSFYQHKFKARNFSKLPLLCFKCRKWGLGSIYCTSSKKIGFCEQNHTLKDCKKQGNPKCIDCFCLHVTGTKHCEFYKATKIKYF